MCTVCDSVYSVIVYIFYLFSIYVHTYIYTLYIKHTISYTHTPYNSDPSPHSPSPYMYIGVVIEDILKHARKTRERDNAESDDISLLRQQLAEQERVIKQLYDTVTQHTVASQRPEVSTVDERTSLLANTQKVPKPQNQNISGSSSILGPRPVAATSAALPIPTTTNSNTNNKATYGATTATANNNTFMNTNNNSSVASSGPKVSFSPTKKVSMEIILCMLSYTLYVAFWYLISLSLAVYIA